MSFELLDKEGKTITAKGIDGKNHNTLGSAKGDVVKLANLAERTLRMIGTDE